jgi:tetratricopeptide (TPR) repeat protein
MLNAIKDFHKAIKLQDNSARAWFGLGQARFKLAMATSTVNNVGVRNVYGRPASSLTIADSYGLVLPSKKADVESAIGNIEKAISLQYAAAPARLQLGDMYRSLGDKEEALVQYREAYKSNKDHAACGFKYGLYWLIVNADHIENNYEEVIDILKKASVSDVYNSKAAYALLWYLFERIPGLGDAKKALAMTDPLVVNDIFELRIS